MPTRASTSLAPVSLGKFFRGVDISKDAPDVAILLGESFRITNNPEGHRDLIKGLKGSDVARMVFEATGAYIACSNRRSLTTDAAACRNR